MLRLHTCAIRLSGNGSPRRRSGVELSALVLRRSASVPRRASDCAVGSELPQTTLRLVVASTNAAHRRARDFWWGEVRDGYEGAMSLRGKPAKPTICAYNTAPMLYERTIAPGRSEGKAHTKRNRGDKTRSGVVAIGLHVPVQFGAASTGTHAADAMSSMLHMY